MLTKVSPATPYQGTLLRTRAELTIAQAAKSAGFLLQLVVPRNLSYIHANTLTNKHINKQTNKHTDVAQDGLTHRN